MTVVDLGRFRAGKARRPNGDEVAVVSEPHTGKSKQKRELVVRKPVSWIYEKMPRLSPNAWRMTDILLLKSFRARGARSFKLGDLSEFGISREGKSSALVELEAEGMIRVIRHGRQAPLVELLA